MSPRVDIWLFQMGHLCHANWFPLGRINGDCRVGGAKKPQQPQSILFAGADEVRLPWERERARMITLWVIYIFPKNCCRAAALHQHPGFRAVGNTENTAKAGFAHHFCLQW